MNYKKDPAAKLRDVLLLASSCIVFISGIYFLNEILEWIPFPEEAAYHVVFALVQISISGLYLRYIYKQKYSEPKRRGRRRSRSSETVTTNPESK